jgi:hypothetical protein
VSPWCVVELLYLYLYQFVYFQDINEEEQLLDFDISPFLVLQAMLSIAEPLDQLWHTVYSFHVNYDKWYNGKYNFVEYVTCYFVSCAADVIEKYFMSLL